jgi:hypothetical protein
MIDVPFVELNLVQHKIAFLELAKLRGTKNVSEQVKMCHRDCDSPFVGLAMICILYALSSGR